MGEPDLTGLRAGLEAATRLPEFTRVERRARRVRLRDRLAVLGALLATLAVVAPVTVAAVQARQSPRPLLGPDRIPAPSASASAEAVQVAVRAVTGYGPDELYAAVDVCTGGAVAPRCSLQVSRLGAPDAPLVVGELRATPVDRLADVRLTPFTSRSLLLSGVEPGGRRVTTAVRRTGGASIPTPSATDEPLPGDRPLQLADGGEVLAVRESDERLVRPRSQPPLRAPAVAPVEPRHGWWVTGADPATGEQAVAVSHDRGATWEVRRLGAAPGAEPLLLATADGVTCYAYLRTGGTTVLQWRTDDGGLGWQRVGGALPLPARQGGGEPTRLGAVVRPDASVLVWLELPDAPAFLTSTDAGRTFTPSGGPAGPIVAVPGGYVTLGAAPAVSRDARTWTPLPAPAYLPPA